MGTAGNEWFTEAQRLRKAEAYYRGELMKAHTLIGRLVHQISETNDSLNLAPEYPTDNRQHERCQDRPDGNPSYAVVVSQGNVLRNNEARMKSELAEVLKQLAAAKSAARDAAKKRRAKVKAKTDG